MSKHEILTRLYNGEEPKLIADDLDVSLATVIRNRSELNTAIKIIN